MFAVANCLRCHRFGNSGGIFGPDITRASQRYSRQVMLRELITPSKQVSDQYQAHQVLTAEGRVYTGRILNDDGKTITLATDPLQPAHVVEIPKDQIEEMSPSETSLMPAGLLNTLTKEDILDLLAYIESGGDPKHAAFGSGSE
jgi:putative heme-binding domain-containing protein